MRKVLVTAATFQPMDVEEIKLRPEVRGLTTPDDDPILLAAMRSAVEVYEDFTDHVLCLSTWDLYLDAWPDSGKSIELPAPLSSVSSVNYRDGVGAWQIMDKTYYVVDASNAVRGGVSLAYSQSWPSIYAEINSIRIRFISGFADSESIPYRVKDGILYKIQELYDGIDRRGLYEPCWVADARLPV